MESNAIPFMIAELKEVRAINKQLAELSRRQTLAIEQLTLRVKYLVAHVERLEKVKRELELEAEQLGYELKERG